MAGLTSSSTRVHKRCMAPIEKLAKLGPRGRLPQIWSATVRHGRVLPSVIVPSRGVETAAADFGGQIMQDVSLAPSMGTISAVTGDSWLDASVRPIATWLQDNHMSALGIASTMRIAHAYYSLRFHRQDKWRRSLYREKFAELLEENGPSEQPPI